MRRHAGYSLAELILVLALLGIFLAVSLPSALRWRDRMAVRAARDHIAADLARSRIAAAARGGAELRVSPGDGTIQIVYGTGQREADWNARARYGVRLDVGVDAPVTIRYDAYGVGRLANRTIRVTRGGATAGLTVSTYGRVRRW